MRLHNPCDIRQHGGGKASAPNSRWSGTFARRSATDNSDSVVIRLTDIAIKSGNDGIIRLTQARGVFSNDIRRLS
jgi:hypothetical protein